MAEILGEIAGTLFGIWDTVQSVWKTVTESKDIVVQGGTEVIGLADAISDPVNISKDFLSVIFPGDVVVMFGIAFTVIIALAMRRSTNA